MAWGEILSGLGRGIQSGGRTYLGVREANKDRERVDRLDKQNKEDLDARRAREQKLLDLTLAEKALESAGPEGELTPDLADLVGKTVASPRLERGMTLPSRRILPEGGGSEDIAPRAFNRVRPTFEQQEALTARRQQTQEQEAREAFLSGLEKSDDPFERYSAKAFRAGINNAPVPFSEQTRRAEKLGGIENKFALERINAQMARYTHTQPSTPEERAHLQIFTSIIRGNPDIEADPTSPAAQEAYEKAKGIADFYVQSKKASGQFSGVQAGSSVSTGPAQPSAAGSRFKVTQLR